MTVPVYIISLASAEHRRAFQEAQAQRLGFEPVWFAAVGVNEISDAFFLQHAFQWERALKKTEVACFMSHLNIWRTIAAGDSPAVVLEDDVLLGGSDWLNDIGLLVRQAQADCICLEAWGKKLLGEVQSVAHLKLQRLYLNSAGAAAYLLWPRGALHLLSRYESHGVALADAFINQTTGWRVWQLVPANAIQMSVGPSYGLPLHPCGESTIAREIHASATPPTPTLIFLMKWRRLKGELKKAHIRIRALLMIKRKYVPYLNHLHR
ncbi:MAG: hypothetical protein RL297_487 [Pseudomonadota bacterium]